MDPQTFSHSDSRAVETSTAAIYDQYVLKNYAAAPLALTKGEGSYVWDEKGQRYLDFTSGIAVCTLGHCHPAWVEVITQQARELIHVSNLYRNQNQAFLAKKLVERIGPGRMFFCNSGTEANEMLLKLSRLHGVKQSGEEGKRYKVITAENSFHGRTFGGMSVTPQEKIQSGFRPLLPGCLTAKINDLESFEKVIDETTAAVLIEPIQGEGGITPCTMEFLVGLRDLCNRKGALLLLDEVQSGIGRTGEFLASQSSGIIPDGIAMAKGLGGGFPIGAVWIREDSADLFQPGSHGSTFGGTPLSCAAALAVLDVFDKESVLENVKINGSYMIEVLEKLSHEYPEKIKDIRGRGFMIGIQMRSDPTPVVDALREIGLLVPAAGGNVVRLLPPLIASRKEIDEAITLIRTVLKNLELK